MAKIQLTYHKFWTKSCIALGQYGTGSFINCLALCLPETYLPSTYQTSVTGYTNNVTSSSSSGAGIGSVDVYFTPVLLELDPSQVGQWFTAEDSSPAAGVHYITVRGAKFRMIKKLTLSFYNDSWSDWSEETGSDYTQHFSYYANASVVMDLTFLVRNEGKNTQYLQLIEADNITVNNTAYPNKVRTAEFIEDVWNRSYSSERTDDEAIGKLLRFTSTDMQQDAYDINFAGVDIGERTTTTPPVRCKAQNYSGTLENSPLDRTTAYIFDFTSEWRISQTVPNQEVFLSLEYLTDEHPLSDTHFWESAPKYDNTTNSYAVLNSKLERNYVHVIPEEYSSEYGFRQWNTVHTEKFVTEPDFVEPNSLVEAYKHYIEMSPDFMTPMEYYSKNSTPDSDYDGKLENITNVKTEPVYFWVETLKSWCTYTVYKASDACTGAELCIWNGFDDFIPLYKYVDTTRDEVPTIAELERIKSRYSSNPASWANLTPEERTIMRNAYEQLLFRSMQLRGFDFNRLKTVDISRSAKYATADYEGKPERSWLDYLGPIGSAIRFATHAWGALLNASPVGWIYNGIANGMTPWDSMKAAGNHMKAAGCALLMTVVQLAGTVTILGGPSTYAKFQMDCANAYNRMLNRLPEHENVYNLDHWQNLFAVCRYLICTYDERYSSNDKTTFQTIRNVITPEKFYHVAGAFENRERLIPYHLIPNPIGAMFAVRGSTGELMLAMSFMLSGPTREDSDGHEPFPKYSGVTESDIDFANEILRTQLGAGYDKTGGHYMNFTGAVDDMATDPKVTNTLTTRLTNAQVLQENAVNRTTFADLHIIANRSKTSSDADANSINTLTKW